MQAEQQRQGETYTGPCVVMVQMGEWRGFAHHAPDWWPRAFPAPTRLTLVRIDQGLRKLLAA